MEQFRRLYPKEYLSRVFEAGLRPDGRKATYGRDIVISVGCLNDAEGSALVKMGSTSVLTGIKAEVGKPADESPDFGRIAFSIEFAPLCSQKAGERLGRASDEALAMSEYMTRVFEESGLMQMKDLCITSGQLCWVLYVDTYVLSDDGSILDAAFTSVSAALRNLQLPSVVVNELGIVELADSADMDEATHTTLTLGSLPLSISYAYFESGACTSDDIHSSLLPDPIAEEEDMCDATITAVLAVPPAAATGVQEANTKVLSLRKQGRHPVPLSSMDQCLKMALTRSSVVAEKIRTALDVPAS
eukprot:Rmarinus@m.15795